MKLWQLKKLEQELQAGATLVNLLVSVDMLTENVEGFKAEFVLHNIFNSSY